ncbi:TetR/AcrR family transcriptional regulator [Catenulispora subtropica]|uniref:TetR/AcrR family transcriptional regulator n=1 Tax=Catenulispora subtropica TaxID=450798 RepID=A0ABN2T669_9ACTN
MPLHHTGYHHGNLRAAMTQAALDLARTGGPSAVTVRGVARRAGVTPPAAYRHFATLDELQDVVKERALGALSERLETCCGPGAGEAGPAGPSDPAANATTVIRALAETYTTFAREQPGLFAVLCHGGVAPVQALALRWFGDRLDALLEAGVLTAERRPGLDLALWSVVHGLAVLMVDGPLRAVPRSEQQTRLAQVLDVVLAGLPHSP